MRLPLSLLADIAKWPRKLPKLVHKITMLLNLLNAGTLLDFGWKKRTKLRKGLPRYTPQ